MPSIGLVEGAARRPELNISLPDPDRMNDRRGRRLAFCSLDVQEASCAEEVNAHDVCMTD